MSNYELTVSDVRGIFAQSGEAHAEFCIEQTETQMGSKYAAPLKAELMRLISKNA
jgi:hypothetical protein